MTAALRHQDTLRAPLRGKPAPRGASRLVAKEPMRLRLPKADFSWVGRLLWPLLLVALGFGAYEGAQRLLPYADRPIARISVQGDLAYVSQQAVQRRIAPVYRGELLQRRPARHARGARAYALDRPCRSASRLAGSDRRASGGTTAHCPLG